MKNLFDLTGKVSIVTGGNGGIGRAIALGLAEYGSDIVIAARNEKKTEDVVKQIFLPKEDAVLEFNVMCFREVISPKR